MISKTTRLAWGYGSMLVHGITHASLLRRPGVRASLVRQIHVTGVQALPYVSAVALVFGAFVVTEAFKLVGPDDDTVLKALVWGGIRELGPLVTAFIIVVRSGVAIAAEVALMRLRGAIKDSHWNDLAHEEEVVLPRVLGAAISAAALTVCFQFLAIAAALAASALSQGTGLAFEFAAFADTAPLHELPLSIGKAVLFGAGIAAISCYHGLKVESDVSELPKAVAAACVGCLSYVIAVDVVAIVLLFE
ncbi:MAG: ABC transporter permease [Burkholderiales bacterium]|nr:ABC transporter permease [Burkholderiales bacterium]